MHMKRVLVVSDDAHSRAWVVQAVASLDVVVSEGHVSELQKRLLDGDTDLVVLDGGRSPDALGQLVEQAASGGAGSHARCGCDARGSRRGRSPGQSL